MNRRFCQALSMSAAAALLSACGGLQPPIGVPGATPSLASSQSDGLKARAGQHNVLDPSFEKPVLNPGSYEGFAPGHKLGPWKVVGSAEVGLISTSYADAGYTFTAGCGQQSVDLAAGGGAKDGLSQKLRTTVGKHTLSFMVGNINSSNGYLGKKSTVIVLVDGTEIFKATNSRGKGVKHQVWSKFSTSFNAKSTSVTITFKSGDPSYDRVDGLDCIAVK